MAVDYEWLLQYVDEFDDVQDVEYADRLADFAANMEYHADGTVYIPPQYVRADLCLRRRDWLSGVLVDQLDALPSVTIDGTTHNDLKFVAYFYNGGPTMKPHLVGAAPQRYQREFEANKDKLRGTWEAVRPGTA